MKKVFALIAVVGVIMILGSCSKNDEPKIGENTPSQFENFEVLADSVCFEMIAVEGGTFTMGATSEQERDAYDDEKPAHQVTVSDFYIGRYEVTQELWTTVMGSNPSFFKGIDLPVECVSWDDCQTFISKLNKLTGMRFRLPTEAEWEYAARGGNKSMGYKYSGSNNIDDVAWYFFDTDSTSIDYGIHHTHQIGTKQPNELGLYDMSGNVYEWCDDWFGYYDNSPEQSEQVEINPTGSKSGSYRVLRGGSWLLVPKDNELEPDDQGVHHNKRCCRVSYRAECIPSGRYYAYGFRLVLVP